MTLLASLAGCAEKFEHDAVAAGKSAEEFAQIAFVKRDAEKGYTLLAEATNAMSRWRNSGRF